MAHPLARRQAAPLRILWPNSELVMTIKPLGVTWANVSPFAADDIGRGLCEFFDADLS
jgi:hypothetical protein